MPDIVLDYHRLRTPIDHPDLSVTRAKLEYPTVDVSFTYLASIDKVVYGAHNGWGVVILARSVFADKAVFSACQVYAFPTNVARWQDKMNSYYNYYNPAASAADHVLCKFVNGIVTALATEVIDIDNAGRGLALSISGSTLKSNRYELSTAVDPLSLPTPNGSISATDTSFASGYFGFKPLRETYPHGGGSSAGAYLKAPLSPAPPAQSIMEVGVEGTGRLDDPYRPSMSRSLVEIETLTGLPDFLYQEARKYSMLKARGFTDDEIQLLLGYIPQHQVDLNSVTWGAFEFHPDKANTVIITITGGNPYKTEAIDRQKAKAKRAFNVPRDYNEAIALYNRLKRDYPHWLAGKDDFAYQVLGWEALDLFQNVDFYYGELVEHKTHYDQLKMVPDWEMRSRLNELIDKISKVTVLTEERDKHFRKINEVLRRGW